MQRKIFRNSFITLILSMLVFASCGDKKTEEAPAPPEEKSVSHDEESHSDEKGVASAEYQCPMDCEDGKTYKEAGSCPVCKMDLKAQNDTQASSTCKKGEDGKCACDEDECKCKNCPNRA